MNSELLERKFEDMGARLKVSRPSSFVGRNGVGNARFNVLADKKGEFFSVSVDGDPEIQVLDVQPGDRHLLLMVKNQGEKSKMLMGHDERHWFVAAIPEAAPVGTVRQAKESLKPATIRQKQVGMDAKERNKRKNEVYVRQGEWFFTPANISEPPPELILKNEPITRGRGSKPHICEYMYRCRGTAVMVCSRYPNGIPMEQYNRLLREGNAKQWGWRQMMKDAEVYVRGKIKHPDHKTIELKQWHLVTQNSENQAKAMRHVAFLD